MNESVVVTGLGIVSPNGLGAADYWAATCAGKSGIGRITRFDPSDYPARLAGEVPALDTGELLPSRLLPQTDRVTQLALIAADWALGDAAVVPGELDEFDMDVVTASAAGGF